MSYEEFMTSLVLLGFTLDGEPIYTNDIYYAHKNVRVFISTRYHYIRTRDRYLNRKTFSKPEYALKYITELLETNKQRK